VSSSCDVPVRNDDRPSSPADQRTRAGVREWTGLALLALPTALLGLDLTILHLALPALAADLRPSSAQLLWIVDIYGFMIAGLLVTMGTLGDRIGRRKLLMIGASTFALASVLAAYSPTAGMLIVARALLGVAGATLMPSTLALISNMFVDRQQRGLAIGVWATMFALGMAAGPVVGGLVLERFWWGAAFLVAVPVAGTLLLVAPILLPEFRAPHAGRMDAGSVVLSLFAILPIIYAVKQLAKDGLTGETVAAAVLGASCTVLFVRRQRTLASPLVELDLFCNRAFSVSLVILLGALAGVGGTMLLVTQYLQLVIGLPPLTAGLWMGPPALAMLAAGVIAPLVSRKVRPGNVIAGALALSLAGYLLLLLLDGDESGPALVVVSYALVYLSLGAIAALGTDLVVGSAPVTRAGAASAMSETVQELGLALGIALLGSLTTAVYRTNVVDHLPAALDESQRRAVADSLAGATSLGDALPPETLELSRAAFVTGINTAGGLCAALAVVLIALSATRLRHVGASGQHPVTDPE
jgi:MFS transporter, DHA2 family, multidrug resistance protein